MMLTLPDIPKPLIDFVLVTLFSLLIGLSQRKLHTLAQDAGRTFGTDRTFTFIGILGYVLTLLEPSGYRLFLGGGAALLAVFAISYFFHIRQFNDYGITTILIALITFCLGPLLISQPYWLAILLVVTVLILTEMKEKFISLSQKFDRDEFLTLAKFLVMAGVILPVVPDQAFIPGIALTPYKIWLGVVVISAISYFSYLLQKFVFHKGSIVVSGLLGGLYSSTATTIIMARRSREDETNRNQYVAGIIFATMMMYLRVALIIAVFNLSLLSLMWPWFLTLIVLSGGVGLFFMFRGARSAANEGLKEEKNPLEFKVALIFTVLYILLTIATTWAVNSYGSMGLNILSFLVGAIDVDPFLLSLFQGKYNIGMQEVAVAAFQAIISNNILKMVYACFFGGRPSRIFLISGFMIIIAVNLLIVLII